MEKLDVNITSVLDFLCHFLALISNTALPNPFDETGSIR